MRRTWVLWLRWPRSSSLGPAVAQQSTMPPDVGLHPLPSDGQIKGAWVRMGLSGGASHRLAFRKRIRVIIT